MASSSKKDARAILEEAAPLIAEGRAKGAALHAENLGAISILEKRTRTAIKMVPLPGGDEVPIKTRLSKDAMEECARLFKQISAATKAGDKESSERYSNRLMGLILYVEGMDADEIAAWLEEHPDSFSDLDIAEIVIQFGLMLMEDQERREQLAKFREK